MKRLLLLCLLLAATVASAQGMLLPTSQSLGPLGVKYQRVSAEIVDGTAVTRVEQVFVNHSPQQLEAHYVFPLPKGAALQDFYLWINGRKTKGEVLEKEKASEIYEGIVRRLRDPGLLEYMGGDVFRARVFPVPANGEQRIELTYSQVLPFSSGVYQYHYPLGAGSRGGPRLEVSQDYTFSARIKSKVPIRSIYSPTHPMGVSRPAEGEASAGMEMGPGTDISKDLDLFYSVSDKAVGLSFLSYRPNEEEPGYFVALISPKTVVKGDEVMPKRITFVLDTSGSMMGDRIKLARESLRYCVERLGPNDELNVIRFSTDVESLFDSPKPATPVNVKKALEFIASMEAIGGTALDEALLRALRDGEGRGDRPHLVMFVTDGNPTVGETDEAAIAQRARAANKGSRVFTFGIGDDLNARLLDRIAEDGHGVSDYLSEGRELEVKVSSFYDKIANPVLADVSLDLSPFGAFDVYPRKLPDLFKGSQVVVMGRYRTPREGAVVLTGTVSGKRRAFEYRTTAEASARTLDFVPRLWAIRKVGYLLDEIRLNGERPELKDEVVHLGKRFGIVTPYTSYLVIEDTPNLVAQNRFLPPPPPQWRERASHQWSTPQPAPSAPARAPGGAEPMPEERDDFNAVFGKSKGGASSAAADKKLDASEGRDGIEVARTVRRMKEQEVSGRPTDPVRVASGRTFVWSSGAWIDSEASSNTSAKVLKVKYLSDAYFALLRARPDLAAAFALSERMIVIVASGKCVVIDPGEGETRADPVGAFLR